MELISYSWLLGLMGNASEGNTIIISEFLFLSFCTCIAYSDTPWVLWRFIVGAAVNVFGVPIIFVTTTSLYSKFLPAHIQGEPDKNQSWQIIAIMCMPIIEV